MKTKLRTGDPVKVLAGEYKGKEGKILKLLRDKNKVIVEGINKIKAHIKPNAKNPQGGIIEKEAPIHLSNVSLIDPKTSTPSRVGFKIDENGEKKRYFKKSGELV